MKSKFGFWSIVLLGINSIIGTGIFALPSKSYELIGTASIFALVLNAVLVFSIALCFAEASSYFTQNGAAYVYVKDAFGDFFGFVVGFMRFAIGVVAWSVFTLLITKSGLAGFAEVLGNKKLVEFFSSSDTQKIVAAFIIVVWTIINLLGVQASKLLNNIVTTAKLLPLILFILIGILFIKFQNFTPVFSGSIVDAASSGAKFNIFIEASLLLLFAFTGFEAIATASEDMDNPKKNLPRALITTMFIVAIFYILILAVTFGILGGDVLKSSGSPLTYAAARINPIFGYILGIGSTISMIGIAIAGAFITPRSLEALAKDSILPKIIAKKNRFGVASIPVLATGIIGLILISSYDPFKLASISVVARFVQYIPTCMAIFIFRKKYKNVEGYRIPFGLLIPTFAILLSLFMLFKQGQSDVIAIISDPKKTILDSQLFMGLIGAFIAMIIYWIGSIFGKRKKNQQ